MLSGLLSQKTPPDRASGSMMRHTYAPHSRRSPRALQRDHPYQRGGGMVDVYCVKDTKLDRHVALKVLPHMTRFF